jgi:hypothetical protein
VVHSDPKQHVRNRGVVDPEVRRTEDAVRMDGTRLWHPGDEDQEQSYHNDENDKSTLSYVQVGAST